MKAGLPLLALTLAVAACAPAAKAPPVARAPVPVARPAPARPAPAPPLPAPVDTNWTDAALTPGSWNYEDRENLTLAVFVTPGRGSTFAMQCWRPTEKLELIVVGRSTASPAVHIHTETAARTLPAQLVLGEFANVHATLPASDPLFDAIALSKGRFAVEVDGLPPLYLPSHAEVSRVIEDCR